MSRIALLNPTYWPEVRRGSERIVHDLGVALAERGHEVTVLTSHLGPGELRREDGVQVKRSRRPPALSPLRFYEHYIETLPAAALNLVRGEFDVAHAFFPTDAYAAALARRFGGPPFVFAIHGIPTRQYLVARRYRLEMLKRAIAAADELTVLSQAAAEPVRRYLMREPVIVPGGVDVAGFAADAEPAAEPTLICAASLADPRKRGPLLLEAFELLRERRPDARLQLAGGADMPVYGGDGLELPEGVSRLEADRTEVLAAAYSRAWASVLPSVEEAFGLVVVESLAAGTPAVVARSGGAQEIVDSDAVGVQFEADDVAGLAAAMDAALTLGRDPATAEACRARARDFDWSRVAATIEQIYGRVIGSGGRRTGALDSPGA